VLPSYWNFQKFCILKGTNTETSGFQIVIMYFPIADTFK